jgi:TolB-like protein
MMKLAGGDVVGEGDAEGGTTGAQARAADVFISYASPDATIATVVVEALERGGIACWVAPRDVTPGTFYGDEIVHAIDASKASVLILSQNAAASQHVLREVERAASKRHPVVSLKIDQAALPAGLEYFLNTSQWLDASGGDIAGSMPRLIDALRNAITAPPVTPVSSAPRISVASASSRSLKRSAMVVTCLIGLIIVGFAGSRLRVGSRRAEPAPVPSVAAPAPATPAIPEKSVAVLAFVDMSEKKDQEYFSDGLSEELIDMLTKVTDLRVPARTSSFYFKGKQSTIADIAKVLRVAHVLEGSVRKSGNHLRITAQLVRTDDGYHVWSETYDRQINDIFKVQDEIAAAVVGALKVSLMGRPMVTAKGTQNIEAYNLYLQGRSLYLHAGTLAEVKKVAEYTRKALAADASYAPAWAFLARVLSLQASREFSNGSGPTIEEGRRAVQRALELDPQLAEARAAAARIFMYSLLDLAHAQIELRQALAIDPNYPYALSLSAGVYQFLGQLEKALDINERAINGDPANPVKYIDQAQILYAARKYSDALNYYRKALDLSPGYAVHSGIGGVLLAQGDPAAGLTEMDRETDVETRLCNEERGLAFEALGRKAEAEAVLTYMMKHCALINPSGIGEIYADRGEVDQAFNWFDRAYQQHDGRLLWLKIDPLLRNVQSDPRFAALLNKLGLAD